MTPKQIKTLREGLGITQQQLADRVGAQRVSVTRWETGVSRPTGAYLKALLELEQKGKARMQKGGKHGTKV